MSSTSPRRRPNPRRRLLRDGVHLTVLSAFALAQPLFDLLGRNAEFFITHRSTGVDVIVFAVGIIVVPPALLLLAEVLAGLAHPRLQRILHLTAIAVLTAVFALQAAKRAGDVSSYILLPAAAAIGAGAAVAYRRAEPVRTFLTFLSPAPVVFLALFLFGSPVTKITIAFEAHARLMSVSARTPVVMVVFDEFPLLSLLNARGEIDAARYPNFAALARDSTWFRTTLAASGDTTQAVPTILTGSDPDPNRLPFFSDHPHNLFTLLGRSYRLNVAEPLTSLCPAELCPRTEEGGFVERQHLLLSDLSVVYLHVLLPRDLRARLPSISGTWTDFRGSAVEEPVRRRGDLPRSKRSLVLANALRDLKHRDEQFRAFVASIAPSRQPSLHFLHVLLPHHPWRYLPSGKEYARATLIPGVDERDRWSSDGVLVEQGYQRHLLQVGFVDSLLGELLKRLRGTRLYERSLVVITADHGVSFRPNAPRRELTEENVAEIGLVPLFIKAPGQRNGRVVDRLVQTTDVLPTTADLLGVALPWSVDGRSAFDARRPRQNAVLSLKSGKVAVSAAELEAKLQASLRRQVELFGSGKAPRALYRVGPHPELLGRPVSELPVSSGSLRSRLADPGLLAAVDPRALLSSAHIVGWLEGEADAGRDVAIAVNGRIRTVSRTFSFRGRARFEAMVPDFAFRPGRNEVEVYVLSRRDRSLALERAEGASK